MRLTVLFLAMLAAVAGNASSDVVWLKKGGTLEGRVEVRGEEVVVHLANGAVTLRRDEIDRIEKKETILDVYEAKRAALPAGDPQARYELGLWCELSGLEGRAKSHHEEAIALDPDHAGARRELGQVLRDGRWMTEDEARAAEGYVLYQGRWLRPETVAQLLRADQALADAKAAAAAPPPDPDPPAAGAPAATREVQKLTSSITPTWKFRNQYFAGRFPLLGSPQYGRIYWAGPGGVYGPVYYGPYPYGKGTFPSDAAYGFYGVDLLLSGSARAAAAAPSVGGFALQYQHGDPTDDFFFGGTIFGHSSSGNGGSSERLGSTLHGGLNFGNGFLRFRYQP